MEKTEMVGTEKQVDWAFQIYTRFLEKLDSEVGQKHNQDYADELKKIAETIKDATWWIDRRVCLYQSFYELKQLLDCDKIKSSRTEKRYLNGLIRSGASAERIAEQEARVAEALRLEAEKEEDDD